MGREVYVALYDWAADKLVTGSVTFRELGEGRAGNVSVAASGESALPATSLPRARDAPGTAARGPAGAAAIDRRHARGDLSRIGERFPAMAQQRGGKWIGGVCGAETS